MPNQNPSHRHITSPTHEPDARTRRTTHEPDPSLIHQPGTQCLDPTLLSSPDRTPHRVHTLIWQLPPPPLPAGWSLQDEIAISSAISSDEIGSSAAEIERESERRARGAERSGDVRMAYAHFLCAFGRTHNPQVGASSPISP